MKPTEHIVSLWMMLFSSIAALGQTPFDAFAPETSRVILDADSIAAWKSQQRVDTLYCAVVADLHKEELLLVDIQRKEVLAYAPFTEEIKKWMTVDPLADKYISTSPYLYCAGNPIMLIDPDGRNVYRYDTESGSFVLMEENQENFDRIGMYQYNESTEQYDPIVNRFGRPRYYGGRSNHIAKGILSNNMNFRDQMIKIPIDGINKPTKDDIYNFIYLVDRELTNCEISGFIVNDLGQNKVILMPYKDNTHNRSYTPLTAELKKYVIKTFFHSHGQAPNKDANTPSPDIDIPARQQINTFLNNTNQIIEFIIIYGYDKFIIY